MPNFKHAGWQLTAYYCGGISHHAYTVLGKLCVQCICVHLCVHTIHSVFVYARVHSIFDQLSSQCITTMCTPCSCISLCTQHICTLVYQIGTCVHSVFVHNLLYACVYSLFVHGYIHLNWVFVQCSVHRCTYVYTLYVQAANVQTFMYRMYLYTCINTARTCVQLLYIVVYTIVCVCVGLYSRIWVGQRKEACVFCQ